MRQIAQQALQDKARGFGNLDIHIDTDALDHLVDVANGDARGVLNDALELAVETTTPDENGRIQLTLEVAEESIQRRAVLYDKEGDVHYDTISAFIKSVRGSDPDAALYWLAKMVYAGEDPRFLFRRMAILAGEDVGMADPNAITVVMSCWQTFERIGMPEGQFPLAQAVIYLATAPKSNTTSAFFDALKAVEEEQEVDVPNHLKDGNRDKEGFGHGKGYLYPHAYREHWVEQQYLPSVLQGKMFYQPSDQGYERGIRDQVARRREAQLAAMLAINEQDVLGEVLTTSPQNRAKDSWLQRTISNSGRNLGHQRDRLFELANVLRHHLVLDLNAGSGLLTWEAVRHAPEGGVWALTADQQNGDALRQQAAKLSDLERPSILIGQIEELNYLLGLRGEADLKFDRILARNLLLQYPLRSSNIFALLQETLAENGRIGLIQTIPKHGQRLYDLVDWSRESEKLLAKVKKAEDAIYEDDHDPLVNWDVADLETAVQQANLKQHQLQLETETTQRRITGQHLERWFNLEEKGGDKLSYGRRLLQSKLTKKEVDNVSTLYQRQLRDKTIDWRTKVVYLTAVKE